tara:strand:- start:69 stop:1076 length:1008 start_codon:yes stop_codon:yes gene_type:complete
MGLKDLQSNLDLVQGTTNPVGEMDSIVPTGFDNGPNSTLHQNSLPNIPTNSPHQDLNGVPDPNYNRITDTSSPFDTEDHMVDLLQNTDVTSTNTGLTYQAGQNTPPNDLDGLDGPQFANGPGSSLHEDSLLNQYQYTHGNSTGITGPSTGDLDGQEGPTFDNGTGQTWDIHQDSLLNSYTYQHGNSSATVDPSSLDADGGMPGQYSFGTDPDSPFLTPGMGGDHMIELLNNKVTSQNTGEVYNGSGISGMPQDLGGNDFGEGLFGEQNNPMIGQGKQVDGEDLHVHLLTKSYSYQHGVNGHTTILGENEQGHTGGKMDLDGGLPSSGKYADQIHD